jgi:hypothetical protein
MMFSFARLGVAAAMAIAFTGCGSQGVAPTPVQAGTYVRLSPEVTINCRLSQNEWRFNGPCSEAESVHNDWKARLPLYQGFVLETSLIGSRDPGNNAVTFRDAVKDDIEKFRGRNFPPYRGPGTVLIYEKISNGPYLNVLAKRPGITLEDKKALPKGPCFYDFYFPFLNEWKKDTKDYKPSEFRVVIPPEDIGGLHYYLQRELYLAIICES